MMPDLQVSLGRLQLRNPVMVAAGTFGYGLEYRDWVDLAQLGAVVTKSLTLTPRMGNPPPRVAETPAGMLNAIGLQNDGVDAFLVETLPRLRATGATVIASVAGETVDEYVQVAAKLSRAEGIAALELNLSCPNQARGGMEFGLQPDLTAQVVAAVRQTTDLPLIAKLSPNAGEITPSAQAAVDAGADILCLINTVLGVAVDAQTRQFRLASKVGGLSGPAIKPSAGAREGQRGSRLPVVADHRELATQRAPRQVVDNLQPQRVALAGVKVGRQRCAIVGHNQRHLPVHITHLHMNLPRLLPTKAVFDGVLDEFVEDERDGGRLLQRQ
jgi:dihydroorotate dehydrogenase (NAD+) catalytic subunit